MFDWVLNTYTPEDDNKDTKTTSFMLWAFMVDFEQI